MRVSAEFLAHDNIDVVVVVVFIFFFFFFFVVVVVVVVVFFSTNKRVTLDASKSFFFIKNV